MKTNSIKYICYHNTCYTELTATHTSLPALENGVIFLGAFFSSELDNVGMAVVKKWVWLKACAPCSYTHFLHCCCLGYHQDWHYYCCC